MLILKNNTTKASFESNLSWNKHKIEELENPYQNQRAWKISDRFGNVWNILFTGNVNEYRISYEPQYDGDDTFSVDIVTSGDIVEIHQAIKNGRTLKSDRNLKQFINLALMLNCYMQFGYLK